MLCKKCNHSETCLIKALKPIYVKTDKCEYFEARKPSTANPTKARYRCLIDFEIVFDIDKLEGLKSNKEYAECIAQMVCDEVTRAGGVGAYDILESGIELK